MIVRSAIDDCSFRQETTKMSEEDIFVVSFFLKT